MARVFSKLASFAYNSILFVSVTHTVFNYIVHPFICYGPSMLPTLESNDIILCDRLRSTLWQTPYKRGDVTISLSKKNPRLVVCKRIVGLQGDIVKSKTRGVHIIPKDHVWLEGDNSSDSLDSRYYGPVHEGMILGRVFAIVWPPSRACLFLPPKIYPTLSDMAEES